MDSLSYLDFDLNIERAGSLYQTRVLNSPSGQALGEFAFPFSDLEIENLVLRMGRSAGTGTRRVDSSEMAALRTFGDRLFAAVFNSQVRDVFRSSLALAGQQGLGLRIRLRLSAVPELVTLPWEILYDSSQDRFFGLSNETPVVRFVDLPDPPRPLSVSPPLRVLVVMASPGDYPLLNVDQEWQRLGEAVGDLQAREMVVLERMVGVSLADLKRQLRRNDYHILHFIGHGVFDDRSQDGLLIFSNERGLGQPVSAQHLGTVLRDHRPLRLVVLNACEGARTSQVDPFAGAAQSLIRQGIPAVIAMQFEISDRAAAGFAHEFYAAIADSYPVDAALSEARKTIFAQTNSVEWATPVLYMRAADGRIFEVAKSQASEVSPVPPGQTMEWEGDVAAGTLPIHGPKSVAAAQPIRKRNGPKLALALGLSGVLVAILILLLVRLSSQQPAEVTTPTLAPPLATPLVAVAVETTQPQRRLLAGIAPFANCPQQAEALQGLVGADPHEVEWVALSPIAGQEAAQESGDLDLAIRGECIDDETLVVTMELPGRHGPPEVIELPAVAVRVSVLDLERAASLARALAAYLLDQHSAAVESFAKLAQRSRLPAERADLTFLQATSLLFAGRYEEALLTYDTLSSDERLGSWAGLNAGVAATNRAFQITLDQPDADADRDEATQVAVDRLSQVISQTATTEQLRALAWTNLAITEYHLGSPALGRALPMCAKAIALQPTDPLTYLCRAAATIQQLWRSGKDACEDTARLEQVRSDLAAAAQLGPKVYKTLYWQGDFGSFLVAQCVSELDKEFNTQQARKHLREFVDLMHEETVVLAQDQLLINDAMDTVRFLESGR